MVLRPLIVVCLMLGFGMLGCGPSFVFAQQENAPIATSDPSSISYQLDRLATLDGREAEKLEQRLLAQLFRRIQTATKITLRDRPRYERLQQQEQALPAPDHRQFTIDQVRELADEVDRLESAVVDHLARQYRIEIYNTFRQQRSKYDERLIAWSRVERAWKKRGQLVDDRPEMIRWLDRAIAASRSGKVAALPSTPDFLARRSGRWADVLLGASPLDDLPARQPVPEDIAAQTTHSLPRIALPAQTITPPIERSADRALLPEILHDDPPLRPQLPPARVVDSLVEADLQFAIARRTPAPPVAMPATDRSPVDHGPVDPSTSEDRINLVEIEARAAGYDLALATLREKLERPGPWTADRLAPLIETLGELATRRSDLHLYRQLVPSVTSRQLSAMASPAATAALLARRIVEARSHLKRPLDAVRLDEFSQRITEILRP